MVCMPEAKPFLLIHPADSVAVALRPLPEGMPVDVGGGFALREEIPQGHKFAVRDIRAGEPVVKYGNPIGTATADIPRGGWVHAHNLKTGLGDLLDYSYHKTGAPLPPLPPRTFMGYRRADGRVGVRNEIWIVPTVGCVNSVAERIAREARAQAGGTADDIVAFPHPYGCSQMGDDQDNTRKILAGLANHPNAGGVLVLGLGCENSPVSAIRDLVGPRPDGRVRYLVAQECEDEVAEGVAAVLELARAAAADLREPVSCAELVVGLKCGGSDGLSGITANPVVGAFSDRLVARGGTAILTEVPEMFGAETLLMDRCADEALFDKTVAMVNNFKRYFQDHGQTIYENPSPGNKAGGISTLEDKSLGCVQKAGSAPVEGVLAYGEPVRHKGLNLLSAPGNDLVASTALAASGAHLILFTTGRGTPFAAPVPTLKLASNDALAARKSAWIDFNCGALVSGRTLDALADDLFELVLRVAGGEKAKSEVAGYHDMAIFKQGVTL